MKLRINRASPFARKARIVAREAGMIERIEEIATAVSPAAPNEALAQDNPLIKIPALTTDTGETLYDSRVICEYLDSQHAGRKLFPDGGPQRFADWNWRSGHPRLAAWFERIARRPSVAELLFKETVTRARQS